MNRPEGFHCVEGLVLKVIPFREHDQIVTVFTREAGIIKLINFGSNRNQKFKLSPLILAEIVYKEKKGEIFQCREITPLNVYAQLRSNLDFLQVGCHLLNHVMHHEGGKPAPQLFDLLKYFLGKIPEMKDPHLLPLCFQIKSLKYEGAIGTLVCSECSAPLTEIYAENGQMCCHRHASQQVCILDEDEWYLCRHLAQVQRFNEISSLEIPIHSKNRLSQFLSWFPF